MSMKENFEKAKITSIPVIAEAVDALFELGSWEDFIPKLELYNLVLNHIYNTGYHSGERKPECSAIAMYVTAKFETTLTRRTIKAERKYAIEHKPRGWRFIKLKSGNISQKSEQKSV